jgi:O-antigen/teichoic acid export membrane protein
MSATQSLMTSAEIAANPGRGVAPVVLRYGLSAAGPLCISLAHFVAAIVFLHAFARADFGLFSFALVLVPFCLSLSGALIGAPAAIGVRRGAMGQSELRTYLTTNLLLGLIAASAVFCLMLLSRAGPVLALVFGMYAGAMTLRWFLRTLAYAQGPAARVLASDLVYGFLLLAGLFALRTGHALDPMHAAGLLLVAAAMGLAAFGRTCLGAQIRLAGAGALLGYRRIWIDLARWSALGVLLTEMTVNAHAYLVTFFLGPAAFAPLAAGGLFIRPVQLVLAAIPDRERPIMARQLGAGDRDGARRSVNHFRMAAGAVWIATVTGSTALLLWVPQLVLRKGYDPAQALLVLGFFAAITAARILRTPESVLLQSAGQFRSLASASLWSSLVSLAATFVLLLVAGPVFSLAGILAGELVITGRVLALSRSWLRETCPKS